jgi:hypothetical protein
MRSGACLGCGAALAGAGSGFLGMATTRAAAGSSVAEAGFEGVFLRLFPDMAGH